MKLAVFAVALLGLMVLAACTQVGPDNSDSATGEVIFNEDIFNDNADVSDVNTMPATDVDQGTDVADAQETDTTTTETDVSDDIKTLTYTEGDLIVLALKATDPDGDEISFEYSDPFNRNGKWQTEEGDAGTYLVTVTANDGTNEVSKDVRIIVKPANKAPTVECPKTINVKEGDTVFIGCTIYDQDGEDKDIVVSFSGWMDKATYQTTYQDAGEHTVIVRATDIEDKSNQAEVTVNVQDVNRAPEFLEAPEDMNVMEGDLVNLQVKAEDPDNDPLAIEYSEPFDENGQWKTELGDAGTYNAYVTVSDGEETIKKDFTVTVGLLNTAPVLKTIPDIHVDEGETVTISPDATDREGDRLIIEYSGWMDKSTKETTFDTAYPDNCDEKGCTAEFVTTVTVSDGELSTSQDVHIFVKDKNRPPVFSFE